jgi:hypothetical protein
MTLQIIAGGKPRTSSLRLPVQVLKIFIDSSDLCRRLAREPLPSGYQYRC